MAEFEESKEQETKRQKLEEEKARETENYRTLYDSDGYSDDEERQRDIKKYMDQVEASGGYAVDYFPKLGLMGLIVPVTDFPEKDKQLEDLTDLAIKSYNKTHGANYRVTKIVNGTARGAGGIFYYLTFCAAEGDSGDKSFQAEVYEGFSSPTDKAVISCELKTADSSKAT